MANLAALAPFDADGHPRVVVESPRGSIVKLKYDPELEAMTLARPLPVGLSFPYDWGFIAGTRAEDGDPVDVLVVWDTASFPGVVLPCRLLGAIAVEQDDAKQKRRVRNDRLVALPAKSPRHDQLRDYRDLGRRVRAEIENFLLALVRLEGKNIEILRWQGPGAARQLITRSAC